MPILFLLLLIGVFAYLSITRRNSTLTRACRWRLDCIAGPDHYRCAACGAQTDTAPGTVPKQCLRPD